MASDMPAILPRAVSPVSGYSAAVRIELNIDGRLFFPTHSASDFLIFRDPQALAPGSALLIVSVDGVVRTTDVEILPHASPAARIPIRTAPPV
jgi:hypothetical protein